MTNPDSNPFSELDQTREDVESKAYSIDELSSQLEALEQGVDNPDSPEGSLSVPQALEMKAKDSAAARADKYIDDFKEKGGEKTKLGECSLFLEREIKNSPKITKEELSEYLEKFHQENFIFDEKYVRELVYIDYWGEIKEKVDKIFKDCNAENKIKLQERKEKIELIKKLLPKMKFGDEGIRDEDLDKIEIKREATSIHILVASDKERGDERVGANRHIFEKLAFKDRSDEDEEIAEAFTKRKERIVSVARHTKSGIGLVVIDAGHRAVQRSEKLHGYDKYTIENLKNHERFHTIFRLREKARLGERFPNDKNSLEYAEYMAKGEILSSIQNRKEARQFAYKFDIKDKRYGAYPYADNIISEQDKTAYESRVSAALESLDRLVTCIQFGESVKNKDAREKASMILIDEDLKDWPKIVESIINGYGEEFRTMVEEIESEKNYAAAYDKGMDNLINKKFFKPVEQPIQNFIDKFGTEAISIFDKFNDWVGGQWGFVSSSRFIDKHPTVATVAGTTIGIGGSVAAGLLGITGVGGYILAFGGAIAGAYIALRGIRKYSQEQKPLSDALWSAAEPTPPGSALVPEVARTVPVADSSDESPQPENPLTTVAKPAPPAAVAPPAPEQTPAQPESDEERRKRELKEQQEREAEEWRREEEEQREREEQEKKDQEFIEELEELMKTTREKYNQLKNSDKYRDLPKNDKEKLQSEFDSKFEDLEEGLDGTHEDREEKKENWRERGENIKKKLNSINRKLERRLK